MSARLSAVALLLASLALAGCGDSGDSVDTGDSGAATELEASDLTTVAAGDGTACDYPTDDVLEPPEDDVSKPPAEMVVTGQVPVTLDTTLGDFGLTLDADKAPCTVNSFLSLAQQGYFDGTTCQRFATPESSGYAILQCGDPTGTGTGGPGYTFDDELEGGETYPTGTLAMANRGPATNGSQFFLVYGDSEFPPDYTVFGTIDQATIDALTTLAEQGVTDQGGFTGPAEPVDIDSVSIG